MKVTDYADRMRNLIDAFESKVNADTENWPEGKDTELTASEWDEQFSAFIDCYTELM